jgi:alkaline phosphatase D
VAADDRIDRRTLIARGAAGGAALALGSFAPRAHASKRIRPDKLLRDGAFRHGVAAGAPGERSITLWTRLSDNDQPGSVELEIAQDAGFDRVVERRPVRVAAVRDHTARALVQNGALKPGEEYFYRFATHTGSSPVGRFRTARPPDSQEPLRIGFFSCQDYQAGYYTAHAGLADEDLDLVVCLGDYIYEHAYFHDPSPAARRDASGYNGTSDAQTLPEYRAKYGLYRTDPNLQAMHQASAFASIWDDHEVEDDWAGDLPGDKTPNKRVPFLERRRAAMLAFFEWMPRFRLPGDPNKIYGNLPLGANAELLLLDTRLHRDDQPCGDQLFIPCPAGETRKATILGATQKAWLKDALQSSPARWKVVANQVMIMSLDAIPGVPSGLDPDSWDGYGRERRELLEHVRQTGTQDVTFMTGDIHTFFAGDVHTNGRISGQPVATEFVGGSITSLGFEQFLDIPQVTEPALRTLNPHLHYAELRSRGYGVLEARPDELLVTYRAPVGVTTPQSPMRTLARFRVAAGDPQVQVV